MNTLTVAEALAQARSRGVARLDAQLLLAHALSRDRTWLLAHDETPLDDMQLQRFENDLERRCDKVPIAYLLGEKEFHGLSLRVNDDVLVPRPETEVLVDWALALLAGALAAHWNPAVVDLGTGSGAIAMAVKHGRPAIRLSATDLSPAALEVARTNAKRLSLEAELLCGPWWVPLADRRFHLVLSNPPYVALGDPHLVDLRHEPTGALSSGPDGLDALQAIVAGAPGHLEPGGWLLLEHGHLQGPAVRKLLGGAGFADIETRHDLSGHARCTGGHL